MDYIGPNLINSDLERLNSTARSIADSLAWANDPYLPKQANDVYFSIVSSMDYDIPFVLVIQRELSTIKNIGNRLTIANHLEGRLIAYFKDRCEDESELKQFKDEYKSLLHYLGVLDDLKELINKLVEGSQNNENDLLRIESVVYYHMISQESYQDEFLKYSQACYHFSRIDTTIKLDSNTLPIYVNLFKERIVVDSAVEFCRSLIGAEHLRLKALKGQDKSISVKDFPMALRNYCFSRYLYLRSQEEQKLLMQDNERDVEANIVDGEIALLKKEVQKYKEAKDRNEDIEILLMTEYFIRYLRRDLGWEDDKEEINPNSEEYTITNKKDEINKRIKYVYNKKGLIKHKADGGVIMRLLVEMGECTDTDYEAVALRINKACGKIVTTPSALRQSRAMLDMSGTRKEGWKMRTHTRQSAKLLLHFNDIADAFEK